MVRGKKVISKIGKATPGDLCKVLRFGTRRNGVEEDAELQNFDALQETSKDTT